MDAVLLSQSMQQRLDVFPTQPVGCVGTPTDWIDLPGEPGQIVTRYSARGTEVPYGCPSSRTRRPMPARPRGRWVMELARQGIRAAPVLAAGPRPQV